MKNLIIGTLACAFLLASCKKSGITEMDKGKDKSPDKDPGASSSRHSTGSPKTTTYY